MSSNQEKFIWTILKHRVTIPLRLLKYTNFKNITHVAAFNLIYKWVISFYSSYFETTNNLSQNINDTALFLSKELSSLVLNNDKSDYVLVENNT